VFKRGDKGVGYYYDPVQGIPLDQVAEEHTGVKRKIGEDEQRAAKRRVEGDGEMSKEEIERLLEEAEKAEVVTLDQNGLQQLVLSFEKKINKNQKLRMKYSDEPERFLESELELHAEIEKLAAIAAAPELFPQFVELGALVSMLGLLTHDNTDISISVLAVLQEVIDPETFEEDEGAVVLLDAFLVNSGLELLVQNLSRLDETNEEDAQGVHYTLQIIENLREVSVLLVLMSRKLRSDPTKPGGLWFGRVLCHIDSAISVRYHLREDSDFVIFAESAQA
jgi:beta-catenin-like protein 1